MRQILNAREIATQEEHLSHRMMAAALAEFATILKHHGFGREVKMECRGDIRIGVPMPVISWSVFHGDRAMALAHVQESGLPMEHEGPCSDHHFFH